MEYRRDKRVITLSEKLERLESHPLYDRMYGQGGSRIQRSSFVDHANSLRKNNPVLSVCQRKQIHVTDKSLLWKTQLPELREAIPGILKKGIQDNDERKALAERYIKSEYPENEWVHVYTDGSARNAISDGGGGIVLKLSKSVKITKSIATGKFSNNYRAESEAIKTAAEMILESSGILLRKVVIFTDALSVITALRSASKPELNVLKASLGQLVSSRKNTVIQWIPAHCNISGNEEADILAKADSDYRRLMKRSATGKPEQPSTRNIGISGQ